MENWCTHTVSAEQNEQQTSDFINMHEKTKQYMLMHPYFLRTHTLTYSNKGEENINTYCIHKHPSVAYIIVMFMFFADKCAMCLFDGGGLPRWPDPGKITTANHNHPWSSAWKIGLMRVKGERSGLGALLPLCWSRQIWESSGLHDIVQPNICSQSIIKAAACVGCCTNSGAPICVGGPWERWDEAIFSVTSCL